MFQRVEQHIVGECAVKRRMRRKERRVASFVERHRRCAARHRRGVEDALDLRIGLVQIPCPGARPSAVTRMNRHGRTDPRREIARQIQKRNPRPRFKYHEPGCLKRPVDAARLLKNLRKTGLGIGRSAINPALLRLRSASVIGQMMIPPGAQGTKVPELIPGLWMRTARIIYSGQHRSGRKRM